MKFKNINELDLGIGIGNQINTQDYDAFFDFLDKKESPSYLNSIKSQTKFRYSNGSIAVPDINERLETILQLNNIENDIVYIQKRLRKVINMQTSPPRKEVKLRLIKDARNKQCNLYKSRRIDDLNVNQITDEQVQNNLIRKSLRKRKKATKYNPYTGESQIVGTGSNNSDLLKLLNNN